MKNQTAPRKNRQRKPMASPLAIRLVVNGDRGGVAQSTNPPPVSTTAATLRK